MTPPGRRGSPVRPVGGVLGLWLAGLLLMAWGQRRALPSGWTVASARRPAAAIGDRADPPDPRAYRIEPLATVAPPATVASLRLVPSLDPGDSLVIEAGDLRVELRAGQGPRVDGGACDGPRPPVSARPALALEREDGAVVVELDGHALRCSGGAGPLRLGAGAGRVHLGGLVVDGRRRLGPLPVPVVLVGLLGGLLAGWALGGAAAAGGSRGRGGWLVAVGLALGSAGATVDPALLAERLRLPALAVPGAAAWAGVLLALLGAGVAACWILVAPRGAEGRAARRSAVRGASTGRAGRGGAPLAWLGPLLALAWGPLAVARVGAAPLLVLRGLVLAGGMGLVSWRLARVAAERLTRADRATASTVATAIVGLGSLASALGLAAGLGPPVAVLALAITGAALGGILWANRNAVAGFNLLSLLLAALVLAGLEVAVSHTRAAAGWRASEGWAARTRALAAAGIAVIDDPVDAAGTSFAALEQARPTAYPSWGYPVAFEARHAPLRVVAFGGSSTGGAYQFDDLSVFYPARLDALLGPDVEVVNQGVGGWTSFHVARYAQQRLDDLDPDIVMLYAGNNDSARGYPATLAELYERWSSAPPPGSLARLLGGLSLVRWLRQLRSAPGASGGQPAVRPAELADNLAALLRSCRAQHAALVLIAEANVDDNPALRPYREVMARLAAAEADVHYYDANALLSGQRALFLDTVHLSAAGHARLAAALARFLRQEGLVPPAEAR